MIRTAYFIFGVLFLLGCSRSESASDANIIPPEKMQYVLLDFIKADTYDSEISSRNKAFKDTVDNLNRQKAIFDHHKVSRADFVKSVDFYKKNPELFIPILDSMLTQQDKSKKIDILNFSLQ